MQVTGWLQIQDIQKEHEGDYTCIAQNTLGMDKSVARLNVEDGKQNQEMRSGYLQRGDTKKWKMVMRSK